MISSLKKILRAETSEEEDDNRPITPLDAHKTQDEPIQRYQFACYNGSPDYFIDA